jgi:hypothetical protein
VISYLRDCLFFLIRIKKKDLFKTVDNVYRVQYNKY